MACCDNVNKVRNMLTSRAYNHRYYQEHKDAGLDYLGHGDWQNNYASWIVEALGWKNKTVLDAGCACGSIVRGFGNAGALVSGCDVSEHMITLGKERWPDMKPIIHCCDLLNLHLWDEKTFAGIHSAQVFEHLREDYVPLILRELRRVSKPGALLFVSLDTEELYARQNRKAEFEDPTHICIKPMVWWYQKLAENGWAVCYNSEEDFPLLENSPSSFLKHYDWSWFLAKADF